MKTKNNRISLAVVCGLTIGALPLAVAGSDPDAHFKKMDIDGDGKISRAEHAAAAKKMFTDCDENHDGIVTAAEMDAAVSSQGQKRGADDKTAAEKIGVIDQNGDGQLSAAEHEAGSEKMFAKMDTNGDGALSKEEVVAGMKLMKKSD